MLPAWLGSSQALLWPQVTCKSDLGLVALEGKQSAALGIFVSAAWERTFFSKVSYFAFFVFLAFCVIGDNVERESVCPFVLLCQGVCV